MTFAPGFSAASVPATAQQLDPFMQGFNPAELASQYGDPYQLANNPSVAAAAGLGGPASGLLGQMLRGIQAPAAPKPLFGAAAGGQSVPAPHQNAQMPLAVSQALKLLPGAQRAGLPTLGAMIKGAI